MCKRWGLFDSTGDDVTRSKVKAVACIREKEYGYLKPTGGNECGDF